MIKQGDQPLVLLKPSMQVAHGGGMVVPKDPDLYRGLESVVNAVNLCNAGGGSGATARRLRRLTREEIDQTLSALFGDKSHQALGLPVDDQVKNFSNNADALRVSPLFAET